MTMTTFVVRIPEAENTVHSLRKYCDSKPAAGAPAHIAILPPFMAVELITDTIIQRARNLFSSFRPFTFFLNDVGR